MKKFVMIAVSLIFGVCITTAANAKKIKFPDRPNDNPTAEEMRDKGDPIGKYTGKYVMNPGQGEGQILVSDYADGTMKAFIKIEGPNGSIQISNASLRLKSNIALKMNRKNPENIELKIEFIEKSDIRGRKFLVADFYYNGRPYGTFQRHHNLSLDIGPK